MLLPGSMVRQTENGRYEPFATIHPPFGRSAQDHVEFFGRMRMRRVETIRRLHIEAETALRAEKRSFGSDQLRIGVAALDRRRQDKTVLGPGQMRGVVPENSRTFRFERRRDD